MKIGIVTVPYITKPAQIKYAEDTYNSMYSNHNLYKVAVINQVPDYETEVIIRKHNNHVIKNDENCLAKAWNIGITYCLDQGCDRVFVANLDIILRDDAIDNLAKYYEGDVVLWSVHHFPDLAMLENVRVQPDYRWEALYFGFMCDERLFTLVGKFDENIKPAYWEDKDMEMTIHEKGYKSYSLSEAMCFHHTSTTIRTDPNTLAIVNENFLKNKAYVYQKHHKQI